MRYQIASLLFVMFGGTSLPALSASDHGGHSAPAVVAGDASAWSDASVRAVEAGKVTLAHGPLAKLGMPAMTMKFALKDAAWAGRMKTGERIRFVAESVNGVLTVVKFEPAK